MTNNLDHLKALALECNELKLSFTDIEPKTVIELIEVMKMMGDALRKANIDLSDQDRDEALARYEAIKEGKK